MNCANNWRELVSRYRAYATRVSQLKIWHFWVIVIERNICRCTFNRYSVITQFAKLAAGEQLCRRCTQKIKVSSKKNHRFWVVTLLSQMSDIMRMRQFILTCVLSRSTIFFSTLSHKRHDFWKKNFIKQKCVFWFFSMTEKFFILRRNEFDYHKYRFVFMSSALYSWEILIKKT